MQDDKHQYIALEDAKNLSAKNRIYEMWKDPVLSKLIANWIWFIVPFIATIFFTYFKKNEIICLIEKILNLDIKLYLLIVIGVISLLSRYFYFKYFQKQKKQKDYFLGKYIGDYKFGDLNNVLLTSYIALPQNLQITLNVREMDLLTCFRMFIANFNTGVSWNNSVSNGDFLHYNLGPRLMSYGLCEKVTSLDNNTDGNINTYDIQTSENGYKFFALFESFDRIINMKIYQEEIIAKQKIINEVNNERDLYIRAIGLATKEKLIKLLKKIFQYRFSKNLIL
jgi:hypothetical protein